MAEKPVIGVLLGDAAGVGPELVAKCAAADFYSAFCRPVVIGDQRVLKRALDVIGASDKVTLQVIDRVLLIQHRKPLAPVRIFNPVDHL